MRPSWPPPSDADGGAGRERHVIARGVPPRASRPPPRSGAARHAVERCGERRRRTAPGSAAASRPALIAPARPIASVPTGTPAGIWTIDSRLSRPLSACALDRHAEHRQRRQRGDHAGQVGGAAGPGDDHLQARARAPFGDRRRGARACGGPKRCAPRMATPSASSVSAAWRMVAQSDWLPMMMPTSGLTDASPGLADHGAAARLGDVGSGDDVGRLSRLGDLVLEQQLALLQPLEVS